MGVLKLSLQPGSVPDLDVTTALHRRPRVIRPDTVTISVSGGLVNRIEVSGGLVLASGRVSSKVRDSTAWYFSRFGSARSLGNTPEWLRALDT